MNKSKVDLGKMNNILAAKGTLVVPAVDAVQRGNDSFEEKDNKTKKINDEIVNLSFKVPSSFRKQFKLAAVHAGITQNELVQLALDAWKKSVESNSTPK